MDCLDWHQEPAIENYEVSIIYKLHEHEAGSFENRIFISVSASQKIPKDVKLEEINKYSSICYEALKIEQETGLTPAMLLEQRDKLARYLKNNV